MAETLMLSEAGEAAVIRAERTWRSRQPMRGAGIRPRRLDPSLAAIQRLHRLADALAHAPDRRLPLAEVTRTP